MNYRDSIDENMQLPYVETDEEYQKNKGRSDFPNNPSQLNPQTYAASQESGSFDINNFYVKTHDEFWNKNNKSCEICGENKFFDDIERYPNPLVSLALHRQKAHGIAPFGRNYKGEFICTKCRDEGRAEKVWIFFTRGKFYAHNVRMHKMKIWEA